jgi:hypothetical protein
VGLQISQQTALCSTIWRRIASFFQGEAVTGITSPTGGYGNNALASATARLAQQARKTTTPDSTTATAETSAAGDHVTLSATAQRLLKARQNLTALESDPANLGATAWQNLMAEATVTADRRPAADAQITALEASDPDHAMIAKQARAFATDAAKGGATYQNPFAGMDRVSLTAIATDQTGLYTNDERDAAAREMNKQQQGWIQRQALGGITSAFYDEAKTQYAQLSPLEKSRYPANYLDKIGAAASALAQQGSSDPYWWMDGASEAPANASPIDQLQKDAGAAAVSAAP